MLNYRANDALLLSFKNNEEVKVLSKGNSYWGVEVGHELPKTTIYLTRGQLMLNSGTNLTSSKVTEKLVVNFGPCQRSIFSIGCSIFFSKTCEMGSFIDPSD